MIWASFFILTVGQVLSPGPTASLVILSGLRNGFKSCLKLIPGIFLGDIFLMVASYFFISTLTTHMAFLNNYITLLGGGFLIFLGCKSLLKIKKERVKKENTSFEEASLLSGFLITALNPKGFVFFVTVLPLFIVESGSFLIQYVVLCAIFLSVSIATDLLYAYLASSLGKRVRHTTQKAMLIITSLILICTGFYFLALFLGFF